MRKYKKSAIILTIAILFLPAFLMAAGAKEKQATETGKFKVALLLEGPVSDQGWNGMPYQGLMKAIEDFGIDGNYTEQIPTEDIRVVMLEYIDRGYDLIIANGYPFADAMQSISTDFPNTMFLGLNMPKAGPNLATARTVYGINGYLAGVLAAHCTKTKRVGDIIAVDSPQQLLDMENMRIAMEKFNPGTVLRIVHTGNWSDINLAREAAVSLANDGCDVIINNIDGATGAVSDVAQERGIKVIGYTADEVHLNPDVILSSLLTRNDIVLYSAIESILKEGYQPGMSMQYGLEVGAVGFGTFGKSVSQDVIDICLKEQEAILKGTVKINTDVPGYD